MSGNDEIVVEVLDGEVMEKDGSFTDDAGKDVKYTTRKQAARLESGGFAYPYSVRLEDGQRPYPKGRYRMLVSRMLQVNKGAHSLGKFTVLEPLGLGGK